MNEKMTLEQFNGALPRGLKGTVTPKMVDTVNDIIQNTDLRHTYRDNLLGFVGVLKTGKYTSQQYLDAVRYVSHKLMGASNTEAYIMTFPQRYQRLINLGKDRTTISNYVVAYNKNILVNKIMEQTLIPVHIQNLDIHQEAINTLATLMRDAKSEKVRSDSAAKLVDALKPPETSKIQLDVNVKEDSAIQDLRNTTLELVAQQKKMLEAGVSTPKQIAHSKLLIEDGEVIE